MRKKLYVFRGNGRLCLNQLDRTALMSSIQGSLLADSLYLATSWQDQDGKIEDSGLKAARYLQIIRDLAINPHWIGLSDQGADCSLALEWLGAHIGTINYQLAVILQEGLACFHGGQRPEIQIFAAPILSKASIDGFCNLDVRPITLVVDPGRVKRSDWHKLVIHELAHGIAHSAGHGKAFQRALAHLCLALDFPEPPTSEPQLLKTWPPYVPSHNPDRFWHLDRP